MRELQVRPVKTGSVAGQARVLFEVTEIASTGGESVEREVASSDFKMEDICNTIRTVADSVWQGLSELKAKRTVVEFGVEMAVESGNLTALIVKGSGKANLKITLEW